MKTFHHYTNSSWADGAALFAANALKFEGNFELIVINKNIGAWGSYIFDDLGVISGDWNYAVVPTDIGTSVWLNNKRSK